MPEQIQQSNLDAILGDLKKHFCESCQSTKSPKNFLHVRSEKEIEQAIELSGLSKSAIQALQWVLFKTDEPKKGE